MTISDFHEDLGLLAPRGSSIDSLLPIATKVGIRFIEDAHTFEYMNRYVEFTIDADAEYPRTISQPTNLKHVEFLRLVATSGDFKYLEEVDPRDVNTKRIEEPSAYWKDGKEYFWLDSTPDQDYEAEMGYKIYTVVPSDTTQSLWILDNMYELSLASCGAALANLIKDRKMRQEMVAMRDELMQGAINAQINADVNNSTAQMMYRHELVDAYDQSGRYGNVV